MYGQVAKQFGAVNDGEETTFKVGENGNTATRMGILGDGKVTNDISVRTRMEFSVRSGDTGGGNQFVNQGGSASRFDVRHLDLTIKSKKFGAVWIGRGDTASNGASERNLAGIDTARLSGSVHNTVDEYILMDKNSGLVPQAVATVGRFFDSFDGAGRTNRIRYDTPNFFGFVGSAGFLDKHNFDAGLEYKGKVAGTSLNAKVGYCHTVGTESASDGACWANGTQTEAIDQLSGSISFMLPFGLGATFSGGTQWQDRTGTGHTGATAKANPYNLQPSVFYTTKVTELGSTTFEYAFQYCKNCGFKDDKGIGHAVTVLQRVDSVSGDYFLGFRYIDAETASNNNIEPLWWLGGGFRQRF